MAPHNSNFLYVAQNPQEWIHDRDPPRASVVGSPSSPLNRFTTLGGPLSSRTPLARGGQGADGDIRTRPEARLTRELDCVSRRRDPLF